MKKWENNKSIDFIKLIVIRRNNFDQVFEINRSQKILTKMKDANDVDKKREITLEIEKELDLTGTQFQAINTLTTTLIDICSNTNDFFFDIIKTEQEKYEKEHKKKIPFNELK